MNNSKTFRASYTTTKTVINAANATVDALSTAASGTGDFFGDIWAGIRRASADVNNSKARATTGLPIPRF